MTQSKSSEPKTITYLSSMSVPDLTDKIFRPDDWQYCEAGGFGDVYRCRYMSDDGVKEVAVKAFRFSFSIADSGHRHDGEKAARTIRRELGIWRRLSHPNIVPFLGIAYGFGKQGSASLVSLWMLHGTLHAFLEAHDDRLAITHRLQLLLDIANGLHYLHSFPVIHGDLTSNNVLIDHDYNARLTDFGCASLIGELPGGFTYLRTSTIRPGTLRWAAPEHFSLEENEMKHTIKSDIYSFGNMALLVLSGKYPWSEIRADTAVVLRLSQGHKPDRPLEPPINDEHWALVERCWSPMLDRPPVGDLVSLLQQLLGSCPSSLSMPELFSLSSDVPNRSNILCGDDLGGDVGSMESQQDSGHEVKGEVWAHLPGSESLISVVDKQVTEAPMNDDPPPITQWVRGTLLGKGTYGRVYLALNTSNGEIFAVKQVEKANDDAYRLNFVSELKMEAEILRGLRHRHIVSYFGFEETAAFLSLFLEYVPGSIERHLDEYGGFNEEVIKSFTTQIFEGLAYLDVNHIIHRNIEAGNILVYLDGICKLSGFGNAQRVDDNRASWTPMRGAMFWTVPEVTQSQGGGRYGTKLDVWTAGCVLLKMWTGRSMLRDMDVTTVVVKATRSGTSPSLPPDVILSDLAIGFKDRCFTIDPEARASAVELLQHPYLMLDAKWMFTGFK